MDKKSIILSSSGLKNIIQYNENDENNFIFQFGETEFKVNKILAEFISPSVSRLHQTDPTANMIDFDDFLTNLIDDDILPISDDFFTEDIFTILHEISNGNMISITEEQSFKLRLVSILLGNEELFSKIDEIYPFDINESNCVFYIHYLKLLNYFQNHANSTNRFDHKKLIDFISSHFCTIDENELLTLPKSVLYLIISNKNLLIESEDSLLDFVDKLFENEGEFEGEILNVFDFYELIEFSELSEKKFHEFVKSVDISEMTNSLWKKLLLCFFTTKEQRKEMKTKVKRYLSQHVFEYDGDISHRFNGIIHHLTNECHGNVVDKNVIKVVASSVYNNDYSSKFVVDLADSQRYFISKNLPNSWLMFDFLDVRVRPNMYSIRSRHDGGPGCCHLKNWVIEGSNSGKDDDWKKLDSRSGINSLDDRSESRTFNIQNQLGENECFRFLRIRQTGLNTGDYHSLSLSALEFFGTIFYAK